MIGDKQITEEMKWKIQDILFESTKQKARKIAIGLSMLERMYRENFRYIRNDEALHLRYVATYISFWMQARAVITLSGDRAFNRVILPPADFFGIVAGSDGFMVGQHPESVVFVPAEGVQV